MSTSVLLLLLSLLLVYSLFTKKMTLKGKTRVIFILIVAIFIIGFMI
ncbi:hypothetical protein P9X10_00400 [Bacillus cereus]|nr:hypothetical protein [Bacillus cereus]